MSDALDIVERLAGMSADHGPDGWPAVRMRDITALCEEVTRLRDELTALKAALGEFGNGSPAIPTALHLRAIADGAAESATLLVESRWEVDRLRAALAAQVPQWLPIESAPKDGTRVILFGNARWPRGVVPACNDVVGAVGQGRYMGGIWQFMGMIGEPTHYMPLPAAPGTSPPAALAVPAPEWVDAVMDQAQVFASAWSLVGGRFDFGNALTDAEEAKAELRAMLASPQESATTRGRG